MRYLLKLSYSGAAFHGWQIQTNHCSVQETLEKALSTLLRQQVTVVGAGRTDAGVSARAYVAHFDSFSAFEPRALRYKLNAILPRSVVVHEIRPVSEDFHARFSATEREYTYFLHRVKDPFVETFSYQCSYPELDFAKMNEAAALLLGRHDFRCFEKLGSDSKTSICTVRKALWSPWDPGMPSCCGVLQNSGSESSGGSEASRDSEPQPAGSKAFSGSEVQPARIAEPIDYWQFTIAADRFLRNMVRAIVGTLIEVGRGKRSVEDFRSLILDPEYSEQTEYRLEGSVGAAGGKNRCAAGESAPAHALFLSRIEYSEKNS